MRVLLDTNIIIHREASKVHNQDIGVLFNWLDRLKIEKCIHPLTLEEIKSYKDNDVVNTMSIKIENYNLLKTESPESEATLKLRINDKSKNDSIDTSLLKELYSGRVDFLITEDKGIHRKAFNLGISQKVYKIESFISKSIAENPELRDYKVLSVRKEFFGNLDIEDKFFNSFIEDYNEFRNWFNKKSDNISYVCSDEDSIKAFLYLKVEDANSESYHDIQPIFQPKKRLKIGTFKVSSTGYKLGERFLKIIFDNAIANNVEEIYVTLFAKRDDQQRLISLLEDWGFEFFGEKNTQNGTENVFVKDFSKIVNIDNPKKSYPFITLIDNQKFIVPIYPQYHTELFPDSILNNESPRDFIENEPHRNALKKVYISRSFNRNLRKGDLIIFYRTGGYYEGVVSTIGVVENIITNIRDENHFVELCRKRSVFTDDKLKEFWNFNPYSRPFVVNFLYVDSLPKPKVNLQKLIELDIIKTAPRGFELVENKKFIQILKETRANGSYIIN
jgi:predicted nucleic acid-binding protein